MFTLLLKIRSDSLRRGGSKSIFVSSMNISQFSITHVLCPPLSHFFLFLCERALGKDVWKFSTVALCVESLCLLCCSPSLSSWLHIHICMSMGTVKAQILASMAMWLTVFVHDWVCNVCSLMCVWFCASLTALHVLWSLLSFLPLMLLPAVCKLPSWCTIFSCLWSFCHCKCLNKCMRASMSYFTYFLLYLPHVSLHNLTHSHPLSSLEIVSGAGGRGRQWNWVEICQTWWCSPTLLPHRSVWMKVNTLTATHTHKQIGTLQSLP